MAGEVPPSGKKSLPRPADFETSRSGQATTPPQQHSTTQEHLTAPNLPERSVTLAAAVPHKDNPLAGGLPRGTGGVKISGDRLSATELVDLREEAAELWRLGRANPERLAEACHIIDRAFA